MKVNPWVLPVNRDVEKALRVFPCSGWYLNRLEPPEVTHVPWQLQTPELPIDLSRFDNELRRLIGEIDDEATDPDLVRPPITDAETVIDKEIDAGKGMSIEEARRRTRENVGVDNE